MTGSDGKERTEVFWRRRQEDEEEEEGGGGRILLSEEPLSLLVLLEGESEGENASSSLPPLH